LLAAHRFLGMLDLEAGEVADAESHLTRALELAEACLASYERALTLLVLARLRCWCGEADNARKTLDEVRAICAPLEAIPALAEANQIEQLLDHPRRDSAQQTDLTMRELEVLRLVARGMTDAEVADALFIGRRTVGAHLSSIYSKLGVRSRTEATRYAVEHDLA
jgi:DNA-binding CsgD family transcriptional regulator